MATGTMEPPADGPSAFQLSIAEVLSGTADWRRRKAEEYDRDARNLRCAEGLDDLAAYVLSLPPDEPRLLELQRLASLDDVFWPEQRALYEIGRFRFHYDGGSFDAFLDTLVELAEADRGESGRFGGLMPEGDDPWGGG